MVAMSLGLGGAAMGGRTSWCTIGLIDLVMGGQRRHGRVSGCRDVVEARHFIMVTRFGAKVHVVKQRPRDCVVAGLHLRSRLFDVVVAMETTTT